MRIVLIWVGLLLAPSCLAEKVFTSSTSKVQLLELYTSEGCSSCPPADRWLSRLEQHPGLWTDLVPVAFHVDYWNFLGWKDELSDSRFSQRQRRYKRAGGVKSVYTPGFVVGGREWRGWFERQSLPQRDTAAVGTLTLTITDNRYRAQFSGVDAAADNPPLELYVALLGMDLQTRVKRGENHGRLLTHDFAVLDLAVKSAGRAWTGSLSRPDKQGRYAVAAWVTRAGELAPLQAVGGYL